MAYRKRRTTIRRRTYRGGSVPEQPRVVAKSTLADLWRSGTKENFFSKLKNFNSALRAHKTVSNSLAEKGHGTLSKIAKFFGYGRRRRRTTRGRGWQIGIHRPALMGGRRRRTTHRIRGRGFWSTIGDIGRTIANPIAAAGGQMLAGKLFGGRRRRTTRRRTIRGRGPISSIASMFGLGRRRRTTRRIRGRGPISTIAGIFGLGRRRRTTRRIRGRGIGGELLRNLFM